MPVFEYRCDACGRRFSALVGMTAGADEVRCPYCGGGSASKLVSRPGRYRTEDDRIDEVAERLESMDEDASPSVIRERMREVGKALDEDASDEFEEMFEADQSDGDAS